MSSSIKTAISEAVKDAMRARQKEKLTTLRMMMSEFKRIEVDERIELDDARVIAVLDKQLKQRKDSLKQYKDAGREDLADQESFEIDVIKAFLPAALSDEEISTLINETIQRLGAEGMRDMGKVVADIKPKVLGKADMGEVSKRVKNALTA